MALRNFKGFESGNRDIEYSSDVTGSGFSALVIGNIARTGRYSLRCNASNIQIQYSITAYEAGATPSAWFTGWLYIATLPDVDTQILAAENGSSAIGTGGTQNENTGAVRLKADGTLILVYNSDLIHPQTPTWTELGVASSALSLNTWHRIDFSFENVTNALSGTGAMELKVDGVSVNRVTGITFNTLTPRTSDGVLWFDLKSWNSGATVAPDVYWDDIWIDDAAFADNDGGVSPLSVDSNGFYTGYGGSYTSVDDIPHDGTTTQLSVSAPAVSTFGLQSAASAGVGGTVKAFKGKILAKRTSTPAPIHQIRIRSNTTDVDGTAVTSGNILTTYFSPIELIRTTDPATSAAWTEAGINAVEIGLNQTAATCSSQLTSVWAEVWSTAPTAPLPSITSISPDNGPKAGGTAVTISGINFTGATSATIGGVALTSFTVVSDTSITGTTAAISKAGTYLVQVFSPSGTGSLVSGFTYTPGNSSGNSGNNAGGTTTLVVPFPADLAAGDMMALIVTARGGTGTTLTPATTNGTWNLLKRDNSTTVLAQAIYWKIATAGDVSTGSITITLTSNKASGVVIRVPDVVATAPLFAQQANASSTAVAAPTLTPTRLGSMSVYGGGTAVGTTFTPPTNYTEPANGESASTGGSASTRTTTEGAYDILLSTAATGTVTGTAAAAAVNIGAQLIFAPPTTISPVAIASAEAVSNPTLSAGAPSNNLSISPTAIASAEAFGAGVRLDPIRQTGISSAEVVGSHTLKATNSILPTAIASAEALGAPTLLKGNVNVVPTGITTGEAVGAHTLLHGAVTISPTAIASGEAFGSHVLKATSNILPSSIASGEAVGAPSLLPGNVAISPAGIASGEAFGTPVLVPITFILPGAVASDEGVGNPTLTVQSLGTSILPTAIDSGEVLGTPSLIAGAVNILPSAVGPGEAVGTHTLRPGGVTVTPSSIASAEAVGAPTLVASAVILPSGIGSGQAVSNPTLLPVATIQPSSIGSVESVGTPSLIPGAVRILPNGIASDEVIGSHLLQVSGGPRIIIVPGIVSGEASGSPTVLPGGVSISPASIGPQDAYGTPVIRPGSITISPQGVSSGEAVGTPSLIVGSVRITPVGITSGELLGLPRLVATNVVVPQSIASLEVLGLPRLIPGTTFILPDEILTEEFVGIPRLRRGKITWQWTNRSPHWRTTRETGYPVLQDGFRRTRRNEGD